MSVAQATGAAPLVEVKGLKKYFPVRGGLFRRHIADVKAVDGLDFHVGHGETLSLVGESGCGKTTAGRSLLRLIEPTAGQAIWHPEGGNAVDLFNLSAREMRERRRDLQIIFQDPYASLNPRMSVYDTLAEPLLLHGIATRKTVEQGVLQLMDDVGLARAFVRKYPHEFSGGQRQRIAIGRALATRPEFVVADEPVSALDVTIQAQILELMLELGREYGLTMLFVSHDLAVVRHIADRILVLYKGRVVEQGTGDALFNAPKEDYTRQLLQAIPGRGLL